VSVQQYSAKEERQRRIDARGALWAAHRDIRSLISRQPTNHPDTTMGTCSVCETNAALREADEMILWARKRIEAAADLEQKVKA
jgi:hypothetical protein